MVNSMVADFEDFKAWLESDGEIEFDMWAQDPAQFELLRELYPAIHVYSAGGLFPFQAEGLIDGHPFYYRSEWGSASLRVGTPDGEKPYLGASIMWSANMDIPEDNEREKFQLYLLQLVTKLRRAPFLYEFEGFKVEWLKDQDWHWSINRNERETRPSWGYDPQEAYAELFQPSAYLLEKGFSEENQLRMKTACEFNPVPVNVDDRVFPEVDPPFLSFKLPE